MSAPWDRMAMATAAFMFLLGFNTLDIEAGRVRDDLTLPAVLTWSNTSAPKTNWQDFLVTQGCLLGLELGPRLDCWQGS